MDSWQKVFGSEPHKALRLLAAVTNAQGLYLSDAANPRGVFERLLAEVLELTGSEYGFIGEVLYDPVEGDGEGDGQGGGQVEGEVGGKPYLKTYALTNISWSEETRKLYEVHVAKGLEFRNLETLFGRVLVSGEPCIANDVASDPRAGGRPGGHPEMRSFLGLPVRHGGEFVGMIGLANRPGGFDRLLIDYLRPLTGACGNLFGALRADRGRKVAEEETRAVNARLTSLIGNIEAAVLVEDERRRILLTNQRFCDMFGIPAPPEALVGVDCSRSAEQSAPMFRDPDAFMARIERVLSRREKAVGDVCELVDGRVLERDYVPIVTDGVYRGHFWQYRDVTARVRQEGALREARDAAERARGAAERASRFKTDFLASMSHEIRTPMTAVVGYADMMLKPGAGTDERQQWAKQVRQNADYLLSLVNGILDLSKIEAGKMTVAKGEVDVCGLLAEVDSLFRPRCTERMLGFDVRFESAVPGVVCGDGVKLKQVLVNLLANAVKFTDAGRVEVAASYGGGVLRLAVRDTGTGMSAEQVARLFAPFTQVHEPTVPGVRGGTGLGLAISRRLAALMGGEITVESEEGKGSEFVLALPVGEMAVESLVRPTQLATRGVVTGARDGVPRLSGRRVLLVDDNPDNRRIVRFFVEETGATVETAEDGAGCVEKVMGSVTGGATRSVTGDVTGGEGGGEVGGFDVVLLDMQMPVMDGYTAVAELRRAGVRTPVVALTAFAMSGDRERCLAAGCDDYLTKPVVPGELYEALRRAVAGSQGVVRMDAVSESGTSGEGSGRLRSQLAGDARFAPLLEAYLANLPVTRAELRKLIDAGDAAGVGRLAHRIKGSGTSYGFPEITKFAGEAEESARSGGAWRDAAQRLVEVLERAGG